MFILILNHMRDRIEACSPRACAETKEAIEAFLARETAPAVYDDVEDGHTWRKTFKKGSQLEWMNPPVNGMVYGTGQEAIVDIGTREAFMKLRADRAGAYYDNMKYSLLNIS